MKKKTKTRKIDSYHPDVPGKLVEEHLQGDLGDDVLVQLVFEERGRWHLQGQKHGGDLVCGGLLRLILELHCHFLLGFQTLFTLLGGVHDQWPRGHLHSPLKGLVDNT